GLRATCRRTQPLFAPSNRKRFRSPESPDLAVRQQASEKSRAQSGPILELSPGVVFLDVQMPGGFEVLRAVPSENLPSRIGLIAYEQHAGCTFKVHASG